MKDVFKSLGINVGGDQSLIKSGDTGVATKIEKSEIESHVVRKGFGGNARDNLDSQLSKGWAMPKMQKVSPYAEPEGERVENPSLKDTHGEQFHSDNDKQVEKMVSNAEVVDQDFDGEDKDPKRKAKKREGWDYKAPGRGEGQESFVLDMKSLAQEQDESELLLKALAEKCDKGGHPMPPMKPSMRAKKQPKDAEQKREEQAAKSYDSLIEMVPDPFNPRTIKNVHENSRGVIEKRRPSVFPELQRSMAFEKKAKKGKLVEWAKEEEKEHKMAKKSVDVLDDLVKAAKVCTPKKEMVAEHEKLVDVLDSPSHKDDKKEAVKQKKELQGYKKSFIKSAGHGGIVFDFGHLTGNPIADNATMLLNQFADPIQSQTATYQRESYNDAIVEYTRKGDAGYTKEKTPFGNVEKGWGDQLNKPMDQQVKEAFEAGALSEGGGSQPASKFGETKMNLGGSMIKAMSETDAAVIEMMKASGMEMNGFDSGTVVDATSGGKIKITAGE